MVEAAYKLSFTAGGLLVAESMIVAEEYARTGNWIQTNETVRNENLLRARTASAGDRLLREVRSRLGSLTEGQFARLRSGSNADQRQLLWLAACKRYRLLYEFACEVIRTKFLQHDVRLRPGEFAAFLEAKSVWHPEIDKCSDSTRAKLAQVALRMLREAEILSADNVIQPMLLGAEVVQVIRADAVEDLCVFPIPDIVLRRKLA